MSKLAGSDNLELLHSGEEALRAESLRRIATLPVMATHLSMIEHCLNLIYALLPSTAVLDKDQLALGNLGIRIFNAVAVSLKLLLSGYYQASALQLRDVLETTYLIDYFSTDTTLIEQWRTMPERNRKNKFKPVSIRSALDDRDGFAEKKRAAAYDLLCRLAGHPTPEGATMLVPDRSATAVHCGPFLEESAMCAVLSECASLATQAASAFCVLNSGENLDQLEARLVFMEESSDWRERIFGATPDQAEIIEELRHLLATARLADVS